jgi:CO/xanthine dehydrogenase FAD-binding subunit
MDLNTITEVVRRPAEPPGAGWQSGDAWLAGGTWLFSEPQPQLKRLVDLAPLGWDTLSVSDSGLEIGSMCTIKQLYALAPPREWTAGPLLRICCEAFLASFKVWNSATVGGNICMSLPAGPMITLTVALQASYTLWGADGSERAVDAVDFATGNHTNILTTGEILRRITIPVDALRQRVAHRRFTLTQLGRSTVFLIGTQPPGSTELILTITAGTTHPIQLRFDSMPDADTLQQSVDAIPAASWFDDPNGTPGHRRHLARHFAEEIRVELADGRRS